MPAPQYACTTEGTVALVAATAKSVVGVKAHANSGLVLVGFSVACDGVTASAVPGRFRRRTPAPPVDLRPVLEGMARRLGRDSMTKLRALRERHPGKVPS